MVESEMGQVILQTVSQEYLHPLSYYSRLCTEKNGEQK